MIEERLYSHVKLAISLKMCVSMRIEAETCFTFGRNCWTWVRQLELRAEVFLKNKLICSQPRSSNLEAYSKEKILGKGNILIPNLYLGHFCSTLWWDEYELFGEWLPSLNEPKSMHITSKFYIAVPLVKFSLPLFCYHVYYCLTIELNEKAGALFVRWRIGEVTNKWNYRAGMFTMVNVSLNGSASTRSVDSLNFCVFLNEVDKALQGWTTIVTCILSLIGEFSHY